MEEGKKGKGPLMSNKKILVTGAAGFIGFHLCRRLLEKGDQVVGLDNLNPYYDVRLKEDRLRKLEGMEKFSFSEDRPLRSGADGRPFLRAGF